MNAERLQQEIEFLKNRAYELSDRQRAAEAEAEDLRSQVGNRVARGEDAASVQGDIRSLEDEIDGLCRGLEAIAGEIEEFARAETAAVAAEADARAERLAREAEAATRVAQEEALDFLSRYAHTEAAAQRAHFAAQEAELEADQANGRRSPAGHPRFTRAIAERHPAMSGVPLGRLRQALRTAIAEAGLDQAEG